MSESDFNTHRGNKSTGESEKLSFLYACASNHDDWDRFEGLHWIAAADYEASNADDPDVAELKMLDTKFHESYLKWGRDTMGWALYLFRKRNLPSSI